MRVYLIISLASLLSPTFAVAQAIDWQAGTNWRLYDTLPPTQNFNKDSVEQYRFVGLDDQSMCQFLQHDTLLPIERTKDGVVWMGFFRVSCNIQKKTRILIVSKYGGFFADLETKRYYTIPLANVSNWNDYIDSKFSDLHKNISP